MFHLKDQNTTVKTEILAGMTTFLTMAYIIIVNPIILADAGVPSTKYFLRQLLPPRRYTLDGAIRQLPNRDCTWNGFECLFHFYCPRF